MFDPLTSLYSWIGMMVGAVDTLIAAFLTPFFGLFGIPIPSLTSFLNSVA